MAKYTKTGSINSHYTLQLEATESNIDQVNNTSKVNWTLKLISSSGWNFSQITSTVKVWLNGELQYNNTASRAISANGTLTLASGSKVIKHNSDGSKNVTCTAEWSQNSTANYTPGYMKPTGTLKLTTIDRESKATCPDFNIGSSPTLAIASNSSSFTHTLRYAFGNKSGTIVTKTNSTAVGWDTSSIKSDLYAQIPNAEYGEGTLYCDTYSGDTLIGTTESKFKAYASSSENKPVVNSATATDTSANTTYSGSSNKLINNISNAKVLISAEAKNSSSIKSIKVVTTDGRSITQSGASFDYTFSAVSSSSNQFSFSYTITDSRGFVTTGTITKSVANGLWVPYILPVIKSMSIERLNSTSNTVKATVVANIYNSSFGSITNGYVMNWRWRIAGGTWSSKISVTDSVTVSGNQLTYSGQLGTNYDFNQSYEFEFYVADQITNDKGVRTITRGIPLIDLWDDNVKVNGDMSASTINGKPPILNLGGYSGDMNALTYDCQGYAYTEATNKPDNTNGFFRVTRVNSNYILQEYNGVGTTFASGVYSSPQKFTRQLFDGAWTGWERADNVKIRGYLPSFDFNKLYSSIGVQIYTTDPVTYSYTNYPPGAYMYGTLIVITKSKVSAGTWENAQIYIPDNSKAMYFRASTNAWRKIVSGNNLQAGKVDITPVANSHTYVTVNFPNAFSKEPRVMTQAFTGSPGAAVKGTGAYDITTTSCKIGIIRTDTTKTSVMWMAYEE